MELYVGVHYQSDWHLDRCHRNQHVLRNGPGLSSVKKHFQSDCHLDTSHLYIDDKAIKPLDSSSVVKNGFENDLYMDRFSYQSYENTINIDDVVFVDRELELNQMNNANSPNMRNFSPPAKMYRDKMTGYDSDADNWQVSLLNKFTVLALLTLFQLYSV